MLNNGSIFSGFTHAVGIANIMLFISEPKSPTSCATHNLAGYGFAEA
ncbi:MAG: hypothetical protein ACJAYN_001689 [Bermanella sp.]|jgi:hypothetical protein